MQRLQGVSLVEDRVRCSQPCFDFVTTKPYGHLSLPKPGCLVIRAHSRVEQSIHSGNWTLCPALRLEDMHLD